MHLNLGGDAAPSANNLQSLVTQGQRTTDHI